MSVFKMAISGFPVWQICATSAWAPSRYCTDMQWATPALLSNQTRPNFETTESPRDHVSFLLRLRPWPPGMRPICCPLGLRVHSNFYKKPVIRPSTLRPAASVQCRHNMHALVTTSRQHNRQHTQAQTYGRGPSLFRLAPPSWSNKVGVLDFSSPYTALPFFTTSRAPHQVSTRLALLSALLLPYPS